MNVKYSGKESCSGNSDSLRTLLEKHRVSPCSSLCKFKRDTLYISDPYNYIFNKYNISTVDIFVYSKYLFIPLLQFLAINVSVEREH